MSCRPADSLRLVRLRKHLIMRTRATGAALISTRGGTTLRTEQGRHTDAVCPQTRTGTRKDVGNWKQRGWCGADDALTGRT